MGSYCCQAEQHYAEGLTITKDCMTRCLDVEVDGECSVYGVYRFKVYTFLKGMLYEWLP
jgi:hypothetical protein